MNGKRGENCNKLYHFLRKVFLRMSGYDKMHQSLLDGQKVCLFIEAFSLHLYRAFYING